ncbi:MAG TPA: polyamine aminopropyltransferase [Clostridiaceae bacterium]|nr:polyamine aminopropyltransferase [Clostridiaceae bacterium]
MDLWFTETHSPGVRFSMQVIREIVRHQSDFQSICILDTVEFGRVLIMDDYLMLTEKDEPFYHEMITHVAMAVNPKISDVLVIGAGDGGTIRELTRYPGVRHIDLVEIDEDVISLCKEYLPQTANKLDDPRVHLQVADGVKFVRQCEDRYDLIIVDSTDPFGPGEGLFTREFYGNCFNALRENGIMLNQHESTFYDEYSDEMKRVHRTISELFPIAMIYQSHIPTYPSGHWLFGFASKELHPLDDLQADAWNTLGLDTHYYNTELHRGAFALPNYVKERLDL